MIKKLTISQVLVYYDIPELFLAKDEVGTNFICLLAIYEDDDLLFVCTAVSSVRLMSFINGSTDLREIFKNPETGQFFQFSKLEGSYIEADFWEITELPEELLPEQGFKYQKEVAENNLILSETIEKNNAIIHLAVSDEHNNYSIDADDLGDVVKLYQTLIENSYKKAISTSNLKNKKFLSIPQNYKLRAFASSYSSFNIHLCSVGQVDLFGNTLIEMALVKFDELLQDFDNQDEYILSLRSVKGHTVSTFKKFVKKLIDRNLKVKHKWYSPAQDIVHFSIIDQPKAEKIYEILTLTEELGEERKEFKGQFVQVDVEKGTWRINNIEDNKEYSGEAESNLLQGITVETSTYKLECLEIIEELKVAEKEKIKYILQSIEKLD